MQDGRGHLVGVYGHCAHCMGTVKALCLFEDGQVSGLRTGCCMKQHTGDQPDFPVSRPSSKADPARKGNNTKKLSMYTRFFIVCIMHQF